MMVSMAAVGYKLTVRPTPSPIRSDQAGWAALVSSSDEDTKPELSPSTINYDTDSHPLLELPALRLASTEGLRQSVVHFNILRQSNFGSWLDSEVRAVSPACLFYPQLRTWEAPPENVACWVMAVAPIFLAQRYREDRLGSEFVTCTERCAVG